MTESDEEPVFYSVGDVVVKEGGDYRFMGHVQAVFRKHSGAVRIVVENEDGILMIFNQKQVRLHHHG